jgi:hypothetical protein
MGIQAVGIIIPYRVAGCKLKSEMTMKTQGRGAPMKWWVYDADDIRVVTVQWQEIKPLHLLTDLVYLWDNL